MNRNGMLRAIISLLVFVVMVLSAHTVQAAFSSGSQGTDPLVVNATTDGLDGTTLVIDLPEDGVLEYTTVTVESGYTLKFNRNANNTSVTILASGDVVIDGMITVNANNASGITGGMGGPGGGGGGNGGAFYIEGYRGEGIGGGGGGGTTGRTYGGFSGGGGGGSFGSAGGGGNTYYSIAPGGAGGIVYGNDVAIPLIGGSGGGGSGGTSGRFGGGGGGGGGAIVIASNTKIIVNGNIYANGGSGVVGYDVYGGGGAGGSGGAVRLVADTVEVYGSVRANGGSGALIYYNRSNGGNGGRGRVRVEAFAANLVGTLQGELSVKESPYPVLPPAFPAVKIVKVGATDIIERPKALLNGMPDVEMPFEQENPISVQVESVNIPDGIEVSIAVMPSKGETTTFTGMLSSSSVTIDVTLPGGVTSILHATVTYDAPIASLGGPIYADGEKVEKIRVSSVMGGASEVVYITESGKEVIAKM